MNPAMNLDLSGQSAIVTGGSRGIGRRIAESLGRHGAFVIATATTEEGAARIDAELAENKIQGKGRVLDVGAPGSVEDFFAGLKKDELAPTILVNNAGITRDNLLLRMKEAQWEAVINTNLNSVYRLSRGCLRGMMRAGFGRIITITSVVAFSGNSGQANYAAAKAGLIGFTRSLAKEVGSRAITVNAVAPGFIETDMTEALTEQQRAELQGQIALGRLGSAEEVAAVVTFLASSAAAYITGETIHVNGGMYMA